jgi:3-hexulose-6-phosphate synthase/6-phospho-3-hexuloisomerase
LDEIKQKDNKKKYIQVSLDTPSLGGALDMAEIAVKAGVDWLEAGTPLILNEGLKAVRHLKESFPHSPVVADLKAMDGASFESRMAIEAGADFVVVMSQAHWASVKEMVKMSHSMGAKVMADILNAPDKIEASKKMEQLGVDWIIVHTGFDERNHIKGASPLVELPGVVKAVDIPVQAAGGLSIEQSLQTITMGASAVVVGAPLVINDGKPVPEAKFREILEELVKKVSDLNLY